MSTAKEISFRRVDISSKVCYHAGMCKPTTIDPNEFEHFPCDCHRPEYAYNDTLCPMCEEEREREREAKRKAQEPVYMDDIGREADKQAFIDACASMSAGDWDADNDWLASAGWGEM